MESDHRRAINDNIDKLAKLFIFSKIEAYLEQHNIFTSAMLKDISSFSSDEYETKKHFLEELQSRGPHAFAKFVEILKVVGCQEAVELLKPVNMSTEEVQEVVYAYNLSNCTSGSVTENVKVICATAFRSGPGIYTMKSVPRGYCLIINNVVFEVRMMERVGSNRDAENLGKIFHDIGYSVTVETNLKAEAMKETFKDFSKHKRNKFVDSCVVIILTHGGSGGVLFGVDEEPVFINEIITFFNNENCPLLKNKPKMFFVEACRGSCFNNGVPAGSEKRDSSTEYEPFSEALESSRLSVCTDIIVSYATNDGFLAIVDEDCGAWYCECLANVLMNEAHNTRLVDMLMHVETLMREKMSKDGGKQATEFCLKGWNRRLYFNPGLPKGESAQICEVSLRGS